MKSKLIGIIVCGMLLTSCLVLATPSETIMKSKTEVQPLSADVPIWHTGDYWTYKVDTISINFDQDNQTIDLTLSIDQLPLNVTSDSGGYYTLSFSTKASGHGKINVNTEDGTINMTIDFTDVKISGHVMIEKTMLGIKSIDAQLKGTFQLNIIQLPNSNLSNRHLPIPLTMNVTLDCGNPVSILTFPLDTGMFWNLSATDFTINGKIHSFWLNVIHFVNWIMGIFGNPILPPELEILLPVVDIKEALTTFGIGNVFSIPEVPGIFICNTTENIVVPAGTYDAYNISIIGGMGSIFYAPAAGNVVKISGNFQGAIPYIQSINMELVDTNYNG